MEEVIPMSGSLLAIILIPVITVALIAIWLVLVLRAASRRPPSHGPGKEPAQPIAGGVLRGDARQMTAHRDAPAASNPQASGRAEDDR
jgi:hypothetical protein